MPISDWKPNVQEVASLLRARTKDGLGNEVGTFTANTRPNVDQVTMMIDLAANEVAVAVGAEIPDALGEGTDVDNLRETATYVTILLAAMNVELSYFPEQIQSDRSPYNAYERQLARVMKLLVEAVAEAGGGGGGGSVSSPNPLVSHGFPTDTGGMIGWGTGF